MVRSFKAHFLKTGVSLAVVAACSQSLMALDVTVGGRVDFNALSGYAAGEPATGSINSTFAGTAAAGAAVYQDDIEVLDEVGFDTNARVDFSVRGQMTTYDYGAFARVDIDPDTKTVSDTDAHAFLSGNFGTVKFGTDIDADFGAYDTSLMSAGPLSIGNTVSLPVPQHAFSRESAEESSLVYISPSFQGVSLGLEADDDGHWMVGADYANSYNGVDMNLDIAVDSETAVAGRAHAGFGDWSVGVLGGMDDDDEHYIGIGAGYQLGPLNLSVELGDAYGKYVSGANTLEARENDIILGASYSMAEGVTGMVSVGHFERDTELNGASVAGTGDDLKGAKIHGRMRVAF